MLKCHLILIALAMVEEEANAIVIDFQKMDVKKGYTVKTFDSVVYGISKTQCAEVCLRNGTDGKCNLAGYHKGSRSCFMSLDDIADGVNEADADYSVLYLDTGFTAVCQNSEYLVNGANPVLDSQLSVSSVWEDNEAMHGVHGARLHTMLTETNVGSWAAGVSDLNQFIQVEFNSSVQVKGIALQGRASQDQHVTSYKFLYSQDCVNFTTFQNTNGEDMVFPGNTDQETVVTTMLPYQVPAQCVRINPQTWTYHISLRFDIIGCY